MYGEQKTSVPVKGLPYDSFVGKGIMGAGVEGPIRNFAIGKIFCLWKTLGNDMLHLHPDSP